LFMRVSLCSRMFYVYIHTISQNSLCAIHRMYDKPLEISSPEDARKTLRACISLCFSVYVLCVTNMSACLCFCVYVCLCLCLCSQMCV